MLLFAAKFVYLAFKARFLDLELILQPVLKRPCRVIRTSRKITRGKWHGCELRQLEKSAFIAWSHSAGTSYNHSTGPWICTQMEQEVLMSHPTRACSRRPGQRQIPHNYYLYLDGSASSGYILSVAKSSDSVPVIHANAQCKTKTHARTNYGSHSMVQPEPKPPYRQIESIAPALRMRSSSIARRLWDVRDDKPITRMSFTF